MAMSEPAMADSRSVGRSLRMRSAEISKPSGVQSKAMWTPATGATTRARIS
jgi:hypothetical protein